MGRLTATGKASSQSGFTLLGLLFLVAGLGVAMAALGTLWQTAVKREKERELLFVGDQYRQAIRSFWETPLPMGTPRRLPRDFNELLADTRFPHTVRHLRRVYRDPITGGREWGLVRQPDGTFSGVYSLSQDAPMKMAGFDSADAAFENRQHYSDWVFRFEHSPSANQEQGQTNEPGKSSAIEGST